MCKRLFPRLLCHPDEEPDARVTHANPNPLSNPPCRRPPTSSSPTFSPFDASPPLSTRSPRQRPRSIPKPCVSCSGVVRVPPITREEEVSAGMRGWVERRGVRAAGGLTRRAASRASRSSAGGTAPTRGFWSFDARGASSSRSIGASALRPGPPCMILCLTAGQGQ